MKSLPSGSAQSPTSRADLAQSPDRWAPAGPILVYIALFCLMTWPWLSGYVTIPWDSKAHFQPQVQFLADSIARGAGPWWNPFVFAGQPQVADPQSMIFSPPFLVLALLARSPSLWAVDATVLATMALGGVGLMFWFRDRGWHWAGAVVAALVFSFGAAMAARMQHTGQVLSLAYWPWCLLFLDRAIEHGRWRDGIGAGIVAAFVMLGRDQVAMLCIYLLAGRVVWQWLTADAPAAVMRRSLPSLVLGGIVSAALVALPVLMTVALAADSNRPTIDYEGAGRGSLHPALLLTLVAPQLFGPAGHMADYWGPPSFAWRDTGIYLAQNMGQSYVGAIPLLLVATALVKGWLWNREIRFFLVTAMLMIVYALGWYTPGFRVAYELMPGISLYRRPADAVFHVGALFAVLSGYATHRMLSAPWSFPLRLTSLLAAALLLTAIGTAVGLAYWIGRLDRIGGPLLGAVLAFSTGALAIGWATSRIAVFPVLAGIGLAGVLALDLAWNNGPSSSSALPPRVYDVLQPSTRNPTIALLKQKVVASLQRRDRVELAGLGFHWPNASMTHRLENTLGYSPIRLGLYSRATGAEDHVGLPDQRKFSPLMPSYNSLLADMLGLRYIATGAPIESMDRRLFDRGGFGLRLVSQTEDGWIYENSRALPRVLIATAARQADFKSIVESGVWPDFDPTSTVLLESVASGSQPLRRVGRARIRVYENSRIVIETDAPDGGYLVLNDVWHPWWQATIDGRPTEVLRANAIFRAVALPAGRYEVTLTFRPFSGLAGWLSRKIERAPK